MGQKGSHCEGAREADKTEAKGSEGVDFKPFPENGHGDNEIATLQPARPEEVEGLIVTTGIAISDLVDDMISNMKTVISSGESMKEKGAPSPFTVESIESVLATNLPLWKNIFDIKKTPEELKGIFSLAQKIVDAYSGKLEKIVMEGPTKGWSGDDLVGFKGQVRIIDLVSVSTKPLYVNLVVAAILLKIQESHRTNTTGENIFFCIRISTGQDYNKIKALKSLYSCVSGSPQGLALNEHLPVMLYQKNGLFKYFSANEEIKKL